MGEVEIWDNGRGPPPAAEEGRPNPWDRDWGGTTLGARIRGTLRDCRLREQSSARPGLLLTPQAAGRWSAPAS